MKVAFLVAYEGTHFEGFQRQRPGRRTVQATVESALTQLLGESVTVRGASRTDSGVHAWRQVCDVALANARVDPGRWPQALSAILAPDVAVLAAVMVPDTFDARRDALAKTYRYRIHNHAIRHPLLSRQSWHVPFPLDAPAMDRAAGQLVGRHDFRAFKTAGGSSGSTVRTVHRLQVTRSGAEVVITCEGSGFLYHMVRSIVGTLVEVGRHRLDPQALAGILRSGDRSRAGPTAPPQGLHLCDIVYEPELFPRSCAIGRAGAPIESDESTEEEGP